MRNGQTTFAEATKDSESSKPDHRTCKLKKHLNVVGIHTWDVECYLCGLQEETPNHNFIFERDALEHNRHMLRLAVYSEQQGENMEIVSVILLLEKGTDIGLAAWLKIHWTAISPSGGHAFGNQQIQLKNTVKKCVLWVKIWICLKKNLLEWSIMWTSNGYNKSRYTVEFRL